MFIGRYSTASVHSDLGPHAHWKETHMAYAQKKVHHAISDWLGDIVALESHVEESMDRQLNLKSDNTTLTSAIKRFHDTVRDSKQRAVKYREQYGSTAGSPIKEMGANLLGKAGGLIDMVRRDAIAKALRDDYTAYNLVAMSYTMLHTTAMAMGDDETKAFAEQGLRTYASLVQDVNQIMPEAVLHDLKDIKDDPIVNPNVVEECRRTINSIWKQTAA
jgi:ferritin-like metal-binding protein YciE